MQSILDPAYSKPTNSQLRVFKDRQGVVHDPDYRHFPAVSSCSTLPMSGSEEEPAYVDPFSATSRTNSVKSSSYYRSLQSTPPPSPPSPTKKRHRRCLTPKQSRTFSLESHVETCADEQSSYDDSIQSYTTDEGDIVEDAQLHDPQKSCSNCLKRNLQAVSFCVGVSAFRVRRNIKNALRR